MHRTFWMFCAKPAVRRVTMPIFAHPDSENSFNVFIGIRDFVKVINLQQMYERTYLVIKKAVKY